MWQESRALNFKGTQWGNLIGFNSHDSLMSLFLLGRWPWRHVRDTVHNKDVQNRVNIPTKTSSKHPTHISTKKSISQKTANKSPKIHPSCWLVFFFVNSQEKHPSQAESDGLWILGLKTLCWSLWASRSGWKGADASMGLGLDGFRIHFWSLIA